MTYRTGDTFPKAFAWSWLYSIANPITEDSTGERTGNEHMTWYGRFIPLHKSLLAFK